MIKIYIANLGAYNRGHLVGKWVELPSSDVEEEIDEILNGDEAVKSRSYEGEVDEEYAIHDYESDVEGLEISEYSNISELNEIAEKLEGLSNEDIEKLEAIIEFDGGEIADFIDDLDDWQFIEVNNEYDLGYYWLKDSGCYDLKHLGNLKNYIDFEGWGRDWHQGTYGGFTSKGYIYK